jgi:hypothetical protein
VFVKDPEDKLRLGMPATVNLDWRNGADKLKDAQPLKAIN